MAYAYKTIQPTNAIDQIELYSYLLPGGINKGAGKQGERESEIEKKVQNKQALAHRLKTPS